MTDEMLQLKLTAEYYRDLYKVGKCDIEEAILYIKPYLDKVNETSKELAKKYNQKHKNISLAYFLR